MEINGSFGRVWSRRQTTIPSSVALLRLRTKLPSRCTRRQSGRRGNSKRPWRRISSQDFPPRPHPGGRPRASPTQTRAEGVRDLLAPIISSTRAMTSCRACWAANADDRLGIYVGARSGRWRDGAAQEGGANTSAHCCLNTSFSPAMSRALPARSASIRRRREASSLRLIWSIDDTCLVISGSYGARSMKRQCDDERGQQRVDADQGGGFDRYIDAPSSTILATTVKREQARVLGG